MRDVMFFIEHDVLFAVIVLAVFVNQMNGDGREKRNADDESHGGYIPKKLMTNSF